MRDTIQGRSQAKGGCHRRGAAGEVGHSHRLAGQHLYSPWQNGCQQLISGTRGYPQQCVYIYIIYKPCLHSKHTPKENVCVAIHLKGNGNGVCCHTKQTTGFTHTMPASQPYVQMQASSALEQIQPVVWPGIVPWWK